VVRVELQGELIGVAQARLGEGPVVVALRPWRRADRNRLRMADEDDLQGGEAGHAAECTSRPVAVGASRGPARWDYP